MKKHASHPQHPLQTISVWQEMLVSLASTLLLIGIVVFAYVIVRNQSIVVDMTVDNRFTLNTRTLEILEGAKRTVRPIRITGFYRPENILQREIDDQYWQLYTNATDGHITREYLDPFANPAIASRYENYFSFGINLFVSFVNPDGTIDITTTVPVNNANNQERDMTEAIARLLVAGTFKVYFERSLETLDPLDNTQQGMSVLNNLLRANGIVTDALSLEELVQTGQAIPRDASALVIARPKRSPTLDEIALIDNYMQSGGALFIAGDFFPTNDNFMAESSAFNSYMWQTFGLRLLDSIVVDLESQGQSALDAVSAVVYGDNEISKNINQPDKPETATLFRVARPVDVSLTPPVSNGSVILTSDRSWGERNTQSVIERNEYNAEDGIDIRPPLTLVAWANDEISRAKVILAGDGDFLTNGLSQTPQGNTILFLDGIGWLTGFSQEIEFTPRPYNASPLIFVGGEQLDSIALFTVVIMPASLLILAVLVTLRRYRR